ncbi:hypothetical protein CC117_05900 [Parafrankia colletiae]|uniref:Asp23/Gls24 family envelope stress response protein n=1 Tax=Parafrankia colletiae TaxID=573497 RepID=A0A1S1Q6I9_9ACTN|nr:Asp23/Gls24 family envelope stress response protein [Parafrankia colletiae]MCK9900304.1 Asp23/Gls24 family envelope stress response protein [Frankia sp. Cpl3]OHV30483.1 hypothetical protein CC117_05900 [Parafrankia colletiae]
MTTTTRNQSPPDAAHPGLGETREDHRNSASTFESGPGPETGPGRSASPARRTSTELVTAQGRTSIADSVVRKIAGVATREVTGVHELGSGGSRAMGSFRSRLPGTSASVSQGVTVEVGERQAAIDLDVVCDYGVSIVDLSQAVRRNVVDSVEQMTGLEVTEVNIAVDDVYIGDDEGSETAPRVQ